MDASDDYKYKYASLASTSSYEKNDSCGQEALNARTVLPLVV